MMDPRLRLGKVRLVSKPRRSPFVTMLNITEDDLILLVLLMGFYEI